MLRRKKQAQRPPRDGHRGGGAGGPRGGDRGTSTGAQRSRRRARPDAQVPAELILPPAAEMEARKPPKPKATPKAPPEQPQPRQEHRQSRQEQPQSRQEQPQEQRRTRNEQPPEQRRAPEPQAPQRQTIPNEGTPTRRPRRDSGSAGVILVTGFEPFGGESSNPSWEVCKRLPREIAGRRVETCRVPCEFRTAIEVVAEAIERHRPEIVLSIGQAGGRSQMGVERIAINVDDARAPDNAGYQPIDEPVAENGPPAYFATLPVKAMVEAMRAAGVPTELSNSAGTYVCNHLMYGVLHFLAASGRSARAGFVHVPYAEEQVLEKRGVAAMAIASMARGIEAALAAACATSADVKTAEGTLD